MAYTLNERRRRVLRAEDRLRRHRRDRPEMAVRDDSARLPAAGALRPEVHRRRQRRAPAGGHPPGDLRQLRALHRHPDRALRRRVSALAGAGPGGGAADFRPPSGLRARRSATSCRRPGCASSSTSGRKRLDIRSGRPSCRRSPTCWSSATARARTARCRCATRPAATRAAEHGRREFVEAARDEIARKGSGRQAALGGQATVQRGSLRPPHHAES